MSRIRSSWCKALLCGVVLLAAGSRTPLHAQPWRVQQQLLLRQQLLYRQLQMRQQQFQQQQFQQQAMQQLLYRQAMQQAQLQALRQSTPPTFVPVPVPIPAAVPVEAEAEAPPRALRNCTLVGSEDLAGYGVLEFRFATKGRVTMVDADGTRTGTFRRKGNQVTMRFYNGTVVYTGTLDGDTLAGTARNGKRSWKFTVRRATANN